MDELGHILREARETKGLTLNEVQEQTRINQRYLEALEMGDYDKLPTPVHVRGFLRNYARFLTLDPEPLLERYEINQSQQPRQAQSPTITDPTIPVAPPVSTLPQEQIFFDPVNMEVEAGYQSQGGGGGGNRSDSLVRLLIIGALLVLIYLAAQRFIPFFSGDGDGTEELTASITEAIENVTGGNESGEDVAEDTAVSSPGNSSNPDLQPSSVLTSTSRNNPLAVADAPSATRPPLPATMETIELVVDVLERAWMEVTIDGDVVFSGIARPSDEPFTWTANDEAKILTGNGAGIFVTINEIKLGRLGERGENAEEVWQTTN